MAAWNKLKEAISSVIKTNGNEEITGQLLQDTLNGIVDALGSGYRFMGVASLTTDPGVPEENIFYVTTTPGTYRNFNNMTVPELTLAFFKFSDGVWTKEECSILDGRVEQLQKDLNTVKPWNSAMSELLTMPEDRFIEQQCGCFLVPSTVSDFPEDLKESDTQAFVITNRGDDDGVQILIGAQSGFQYTRRMINGVLMGWTVVQGDTIYYATFDVNPFTGELFMHTDPGYTGANFHVENGELFVTI